MPLNLPSDPQAPWPPKDQGAQYAKFAEWSAWYSGDPERLREVYDGAPGHAARRWYKFWGRISQDPEAQKAQLHVPIAGDLAAVSGALLFGEEPRIHIVTEEGKPGGTEAEKRLRRIKDDSGLSSRLVEGAETAAAMGGAYMFPAWDKELADYPIPAIAQADQAIPEFRHGVLRSVLLWREVERDGNIVYRHLELHRPGVPGFANGKAFVQHAVYKGTRSEIGARQADDWTMSLVGFQPLVTLPFQELDVQYIPNMRPNRLWRQSSLGLSDFSGSEGMFDALDEVYASWMRDIRLGKARIIVPRDFIDESGSVDIDHEVYQPMDMEPGASEAGARSMLAQQFEIRYNEHRETAIELVERIVSNSGYSPQTFGIRIEGRAESGSALRIRENKTILTLKRKSQWWGPGIRRLLAQLMAVDKEVFGGPGLAVTDLVEVALSAGVPEDPVELAQTVAQISAAQAASLQTKVRILHPHWSREEVDSEVKRIQEELEAAKPEPPAITPPPGGMTIEQDSQTGEASARTERAIAQDEGDDSA